MAAGMLRRSKGGNASSLMAAGMLRRSKGGNASSLMAASMFLRGSIIKGLLHRV